MFFIEKYKQTKCFYNYDPLHARNISHEMKCDTAVISLSSQFNYCTTFLHAFYERKRNMLDVKLVNYSKTTLNSDLRFITKIRLRQELSRELSRQLFSV